MVLSLTLVSWVGIMSVIKLIKLDYYHDRKNGMFYVNRNIDETCTNIYALTVDGMENVECAKRSVPLQVMQREFTRGNVRFSDLSCKYTMLNKLVIVLEMLTAATTSRPLTA